MNAADFIRQRLAEIRDNRWKRHLRWQSACECCDALPALVAALEAVVVYHDPDCATAYEHPCDCHGGDTALIVAESLGWRE